jgi:hypothetical protein
MNEVKKMTIVSLFRFGELPQKEEIIARLDGRKENGFWFKAKESRHNEDEVEIDIWYEEDIELGMRRAFSDEGYEMAEYLKQRGKEKVIRKVYCFIDLKLKTLEIYRGQDSITETIKEKLEQILSTTFSPVSLTPEQLVNIVNTYSSELKQAMFKYIHGLWYHIIRGRHLEANGKYKSYLETKPDSLRMVSVTPKIKYMNGRDYMVTINGDKGTIRMCDGFFKWKPRFEVKQIVNLVVGVTNFSF